MSKQFSEQTLADHIKHLPKEMQPQRDLWSGIEYAIQNKSQSLNQDLDHDNKKNIKHRTVFPMAWAATIIIAILVAWVSFSPSQLPLTNTLTTNVQEGEKHDAAKLVSLMQKNFSQQKKAMLVSYGEPDMSNLSVNMQNQLVALAQARKAIESALMNDGNNVDLLNLLQLTQQQELNLLQRLFPSLQNQQWQTI